MSSKLPLVVIATLGAVAMGLIASPAALAAAPAPVRPVSAEVFSGRWYEVARTPNLRQRDCLGSTTDFEPRPDGGMAVTETCRRAGPVGLARVVRARARVLQLGDNTRFRVSLLGGLIHQDYWILDHADDNAWMLMGTPGGHYVWVLSRRPALSSASLAAAVSRASALGYPSSSLIFPTMSGG